MPTVLVWWAHLRDARPELQRLLDATERERLSGYSRQPDADRFLLGAAIIRLVAAHEMGLRPAAVEIVRCCGRCGGAHGQVRLPGRAGHVSVSHSGDVVGIAFCRDAAVGLDVEAREDNFDPRELAGHTLTRTETTAYSRVAVRDRRAAFLRYWVRKEALLKLTGDGIVGGLDTLTVSAPDAEPELLAWPGRADTVSRFSLRDVDPRPDRPAALAIDCTGPVDVRERDAAVLLRGGCRRYSPSSTPLSP